MNSINEKIENLLIGGDLRSIGQSSKVVKLINKQYEFDILFSFISSDDRLTAMRTADSIEKITRRATHYLDKHKKEIIELCDKAADKELKWHLAQIVPRLNLTKQEVYKVFTILKNWTLDKNESKIVRANSLQALFEIIREDKTIKGELDKVVCQIKLENIPSLNARVRKMGL